MTEQTDNTLAVVAAEQAVTDALRGLTHLAEWRQGLQQSAAATALLARSIGATQDELEQVREPWVALDALAAVVELERKG